MTAVRAKYFSRSCKINTYIPDWERSKTSYESLMDKRKYEIEYLENALRREDEGYLEEHFREYFVDTEDLDEIISKYTSLSTSTVILFNWDVMSPFLNTAYDNEHYSLKLIKDTLNIENSESGDLENQRSEHVFFHQGRNPRLSEDKYLHVGDFIHMIERPYAHIGLCANNAENGQPIEFNKLNQFYLENTYENPGKKHKYLKEDTSINRCETATLTFKTALTHIFTCSMQSGKNIYENVFYFVNPATPDDQVSVIGVKQTIKYLMLKYISKNKFDETFPSLKFHLVLTKTRSGYNCEKFYTPPKDLNAIAKSKVNQKKNILKYY